MASVLSAGLTGIALALMARMLLRYHRELRPICRISIGIMGAGLLLTLVEFIHHGSPFADWSNIVLRAGIVGIFYEYGCKACRERQLAETAARRRGPSHSAERRVDQSR